MEGVIEQVAISQAEEVRPIKVITVEQGARGGFGAQVLEYMANSGGLDHGVRLRTLTLPDRFIEQASPAAMYADAGLSVADITRAVERVLPQRVQALRA